MTPWGDTAGCISMALERNIALPRRHSSTRCFLTRACLVLGVSLAISAAEADNSEKLVEDLFESAIRPVLATRCVSCHGPERKEGGLRLDSRDALAVTVTTGVFVRVLRGDSTAPISCVVEERFANAFDHWIALGMPWPEAATVTTAADRAGIARRHWAFQPIRRPDVPEAVDGGTSNPIDAFVREALDAGGLSPSSEANRRTLMRRVSYALTGLPPSPGEVALFVEDSDPHAWEKLVERLLASDHYGEHWARHWLDIARYSDTKGYVYAREEKNWPHAWAYRDWVVAALNEDMPYDRFVLLQLAADRVEDRRLGDMAAMGFLTLGRRFLGVKDDIIDDRIDVVTRGMLGLTVGCARCHDHKYDPIPAADYYALHGVFASSVETLVPLADGHEAFSKEHQDRVRARDEAMARFRTEASDRVRSRLGDYLRAQSELDKYPADDFGQILQKTDLLPAFVHAWRDALRDAAESQYPVFAPWHAYARLAPEEFAENAPAVMESLAKSGRDPVPPLIAKAFSLPPNSFEEVADRYAAVFGEIDGRWKALLREAERTETDPPVSLPDPDEEALRAVLYGGGSPCEVPEGGIADVEAFFESETTKELWKRENEIATGLIKAREAIPVALALADRERPLESRLLLRGNPLNQGEKVPRQFLGILSGEGRRPFAHGSGRLELAKAIADEANPLTARVIVNRVWAQHFGTGLVPTPSDFGVRSDPPSHPALLDWLAAQFMEDGWSLKALHRRILASATYRQSSFGPLDAESRSANLAVDPENRLLWRMNPHRLGYEEFRDSMMLVSGDLDRRIGGKPVEAFKAPYTSRRAIYGKVDRQFVPGVLRVFDFANPDLHIPQRNETSVPQQALFFLNHPFVLERSRALAKVTNSEKSSAERVRVLFRRILQREPEDGEIAESLALVGAAEETVLPTAPDTAADWQYGYGAMNLEQQRVDGFNPLPHFTGSAWQGGAAVPDPKLGWVYLNARGGHPGNTVSHAAVRRWTAPRAMTLTIRSKLTHEPTAGDGIRGFLVSSRLGLLGSASLHAKSIDLEVEDLAVEAGETIDFLVDIGKGLNNDQFLWEISLTNTVIDGEKPAGVWNAANDFSAPQESRLTAWEQLAQALLCSNEFLFVD